MALRYHAALPSLGLGLALGSSLLAGSLLTGCGSNSGSNSTGTVGSANPGTFQIMMADAPVTGLQAVNVTLTKVEALYDGERDSQLREQQSATDGSSGATQSVHHGGHIQQAGTDPTQPGTSSGTTTGSTTTGSTTTGSDSGQQGTGGGASTPTGGERDDGDGSLPDDNNDQWVTLSTDSHTLNLLDYANKPVSALFSLVNVNVPSGQYKKFRFTIGAVQLVFLDGRQATPTLVNNTVVVRSACFVGAHKSENLVMDFDVAQSLQTDGSGNYTFDSKLRLRPQKTSGSVTGTVQFQSTTPASSFEAHVELKDASGQVVAESEVEVEPSTAQSSAQANFTLHAVPPGSYSLVVTGDDAFQGTVSNPETVQVTTGQSVQAGTVSLSH